MAILEVKNIEKHFGSTQVLKDVSFSMEEGSALAIIGSSGSGKTTLLRCLNFLETLAVDVFLCDVDVVHISAFPLLETFSACIIFLFFGISREDFKSIAVI